MLYFVLNHNSKKNYLLLQLPLLFVSYINLMTANTRITAEFFDIPHLVARWSSWPNSSWHSSTTLQKQITRSKVKHLYVLDISILSYSFSRCSNFSLWPLQSSEPVRSNIAFLSWGSFWSLHSPRSWDTREARIASSTLNKKKMINIYCQAVDVK